MKSSASLICLHFISFYLNFCCSAETASFYGASYVSVPLQEAKSTTELSLKFRTKRSDALLFLAAGRTDYCLIILESGKLKVRINLGAGESEISSPKGLRLNDLLWHHVTVSRREADITLTIDKIHVTKEKLPGRFFELNIHYGLFLGGMGDFSELFLGHLDWFRGCLSQISYNGVDALKRARARSGQSDAQGVTWSCAPEFDAPNDSEISFIEDGAYISLPNLILRTGVRLQFDLKTVLDHGVLLYSSGPVAGGRADFIGVEILNRRLHLLFDQGNGPIELSNDNVVADGEWHTVTINLNPTVASITVDSQMPSTAKIAAHAGNKYLDLSDMLFFGGIELNKRSKALGQGLKTADASFKGCVRNLETDGRRVGVADVMTSLGIIPQCVWSFPCSQDPCLTKASCSHQGVNSYKCDCDQSTCAKPDFVNRDKMFLKTPLPVALEILTLEPLLVSEGENALITPAHINMVLDSVKYGVRESNILFYRVEPPQHGRLFLEVWERGSNPNQVFTLLDLSQDKVRYLHDGSENHQDSITFDLELSPGAGFTLPNYLKGRHRFSLLINITAVNDPPLLVIPSSKVLKVVLCILSPSGVSSYQLKGENLNIKNKIPETL